MDRNDPNGSRKGSGEINLESLFAAVLRKWKWMLLFALIAALCAGYLSMRDQKKAAASAKAALAAQKEKAAAEVAEEQKEDLEDGLPDLEPEKEALLRVLSDRVDYMDNSLSLKINGNAEGRSRCEFYIVTDRLREERKKRKNETTEVSSQSGEEGDASSSGDDSSAVMVADMTDAEKEAYEILSFYVTRMTTDLDLTKATELFNADRQYVKELYSVSGANQTYIRATISTWADSKENAKLLMDCIRDQIPAVKEKAEAQFVKHEVILTDSYEYTIIDRNVMNGVQDRSNEINNLINTYNTLVRYEKQYRENLFPPAPAVEEEEQEAIVVPRVSRRKAVKMAAAGFVGGMILFAVLCALYLTASSRVLSGRDVNTAYGTPKLAAVPTPAAMRAKGLGRKLASYELRYASNRDPEKCYAIANENVRALLGSGEAVIGLIGDIGNEELAKTQEALSAEAGAVRYEVLGDLSEPADVKRLGECDSVVLVARPMRSRYRDLTDIVSQVEDRKKGILGSIIC